MRNVKFVTCLLAGLLAWAALTPVEAQRNGGLPHHDGACSNGLALDEAVVHVRRDTGGRVLSAQTREHRSGTSYRIKVLLPNASVRYVDIEAPSRERY